MLTPTFRLQEMLEMLGLKMLGMLEQTFQMKEHHEFQWIEEVGHNQDKSHVSSEPANVEEQNDVNGSRRVESTNTHSEKAAQTSSEVSTGNDENRRFREGRMRVEEVYKLHANERIEIEVDRHGIPCSHSYFMLVSFLGRLARNGNMCPIHIKAWSDEACMQVKSNIVNCVQRKFLYPQGLVHLILIKTGEVWKKYKVSLKKKHFYCHQDRTFEAIVKRRPAAIDETQWTLLVSKWVNPQYQEQCDRNTEHGKNVVPHTMGRTTYAMLSKTMEERDGKEPDRIELYEVSRNRKDGSYVRSEVQQKMEEVKSLKTTAAEDPTISSDEIFKKVWGPEHSGRVHGMGAGVTPNSYFGASGAGGGYMIPPDVPTMSQFNELASMVKDMYNILKDDIAARKYGQGGGMTADATSGAGMHGEENDNGDFDHSDDSE